MKKGTRPRAPSAARMTWGSCCAVTSSELNHPSTPIHTKSGPANPFWAAALSAAIAEGVFPTMRAFTFVFARLIACIWEVSVWFGSVVSTKLAIPLTMIPSLSQLVLKICKDGGRKRSQWCPSRGAGVDGSVGAPFLLRNLTAISSLA